MLNDIYGFSCVENQTLDILRAQGQDIVSLYHEAAIPLTALAAYFSDSERRPENFHLISRIQNELKVLGILRLDLCHQPVEACLWTLAHTPAHDKHDVAILVKCNPSFVKNTLRAQGWRDDHYLRVRQTGRQFELTNDIPALTLTVDQKQFIDLYAGAYFRLAPLRHLTAADAETLRADRLYKAEAYTPQPLPWQAIAAFPDPGVLLQRILTVYKVLRRRLAAYYGLYADTQFLFDTISDIDRCYTLCEYYHKKNASLDKYEALLKSIHESETNDFTKLKERLTEHGVTVYADQ